MKKLFIITLMLACVSLKMLQAQDTPKYTIVHKDTINIRGIVYDAQGKPAPSVSITSKNKNLKTPAYPLSTLTDSKGRFLLNEALVKDTLKIEFFGGSFSMINNSSGT